MTSSSKSYKANLVVAVSKTAIPAQLHRPIIEACALAISSRLSFVIALSGGSLPSFLSTLSLSFDAAGVDPCFDKWHVLLADERCVPSTHDDSNLKSLKEQFLDNVPIPPSQVHGIDEALLSDPHTTEDVASSYEASALRSALVHSDGKIDCAVLGFGPDGHTCSLFPGHALLKATKRLVATIADSPKPPPNRVTLTLPALNDMTRSVVFCGAGSSKEPILKAVFSRVGAKGEDDGAKVFEVVMADPAPYPCGMVRPMAEDTLLSPAVIWVVDEDAAKGLNLGECKL